MEVRNQGKTRYKSIEEKYPNPCKTCPNTSCVKSGRTCGLWETRYFWRQKAINGFAKKYQIQPSTIKAAKDPCEGCGRNEYCDNICPARAKWWDIQMKKLKEELKLSD